MFYQMLVELNLSLQYSLTLGAHAHEGYSTYFVCVCVSVPSLLLPNRAYMTKWSHLCAVYTPKTTI